MHHFRSLKFSHRNHQSPFWFRNPVQRLPSNSFVCDQGIIFHLYSIVDITHSHTKSHPTQTFDTNHQIQYSPSPVNFPSSDGIHFSQSLSFLLASQRQLSCHDSEIHNGTWFYLNPDFQLIEFQWTEKLFGTGKVSAGFISLKPSTRKLVHELMKAGLAG
jgi:hypothetical protein